MISLISSLDQRNCFFAGIRAAKSKLDKKYPATQKGGRIKVAGAGMAIGHLRLTFELLRDKLIINEKR